MGSLLVCAQGLVQDTTAYVAQDVFVLSTSMGAVNLYVVAHVDSCNSVCILDRLDLRYMSPEVH